MQITLPPEAQAIIDRKLATGEYASEIEVIVRALAHLDVVDDLPRIPSAMLDRARAQAARGETMPLTNELRAEIRRDAVAKMGSGVPVSDDITY